MRRSPPPLSFVRTRMEVDDDTNPARLANTPARSPGTAIQAPGTSRRMEVDEHPNHATSANPPTRPHKRIRPTWATRGTSQAQATPRQDTSHRMEVDDDGMDQAGSNSAKTKPTWVTQATSPQATSRAQATSQTQPGSSNKAHTHEPMTIGDLFAHDLDDDEDDGDYKPPKAKRAKPNPVDDAEPGEWTAAKRQHLVEALFDFGYRNMDAVALAAELDLKLVQVKNQLQIGRNTVRARCVRFAGGPLGGGHGVFGGSRGVGGGGDGGGGGGVRGGEGE